MESYYSPSGVVEVVARRFGMRRQDVFDDRGRSMVALRHILFSVVCTADSRDVTFYESGVMAFSLMIFGRKEIRGERRAMWVTMVYRITFRDARELCLVRHGLRLLMDLLGNLKPIRLESRRL